MSRLRQTTMWFGVMGLVCASILALGATATRSGLIEPTEPSAWSGIAPTPVQADAVVPERPAPASADPAKRIEPIRPVLLWWVAAIAALLLAIMVRRRRTSSPALAPPTIGRPGRFDRGPPLGLSIP